ncbi:glycosyltransferase [Prochlorococcus sp. AH-716-O10]|nr:glycosyltransferase [Prochlorococcus sp. AH-716-O10]
MYYKNWALIVPLANEEKEFKPFIEMVKFVIDVIPPGKVYFVIDKVSKDNTKNLCLDLSKKDDRFKTIWAPDNKNVVDAYIKGLKVAYENKHDIFIEMDAGLSHDPRAIPMFLRVLNEGNECAFGSRFVMGGSMSDSPLNRRFFSGMGTFLSKVLLGTRMSDMTSGFQGFHRNIVEKILNHEFKSSGHFYQTELRYLLKKYRFAEVPIHYKAPSPSVSIKSINNSISTLFWLFFQRVLGGKTHL